MNPFPPPPRPAWSEVPPALVARLEGLLGGRIIAAETLTGGFSPTAVFAARLEDGRKIFLKGTHPGQQAHGTQMLRQEVEVYRHVPLLRELAPAFLGLAGDGDEDGWLLAAFAYVAAVPVPPWTAAQVEAAFSALARLHACGDSGLPAAREKNFVSRYFAADSGWLRLRRAPEVAQKFLGLFAAPAAGREWLEQALPLLCAAQHRLSAVRAPAALLHQDLRGDNFLFDRAGRAYLIDWQNACHGPVVLDVAQLLAALAAEGAGAPEGLLRLYEKISGLTLSRDDLAAALAALAGYMAENAWRAVPPQLPGLRALQKSQLRAMLDWAGTLIRIPPLSGFAGEGAHAAQ